MIIKKRLKRIIILLIIVAGLLFIVKNFGPACKGVYDKVIGLVKGRKALEERPEIMFPAGEKIIPVKVFKATRTAFKDTLPVLGTVKGYREADLRFEKEGMLESFNFEEGEPVEEGDIIASLNQRDALLRLEYQKIELDKAEKLYEVGAVIESELEKAKLEYESSKHDFEKTNLYAPRDGYLGRKHAEEGEYVSPNDVVTTFVDIKTVYAEFGIIEKDMAKVANNQAVEAFVDAYPGKSYNGVVDQIIPIVEGKSRTQTVKVKLDNPGDRLKPGMFVRGVIATYEKEDALIVPTTAVKKKEPGFIVYVIHETDAKPEGEEGDYGTVEIRPVELAYMAPDFAEISKDLEVDELVAVEVRDELQDKQTIEITEVQESPF